MSERTASFGGVEFDCLSSRDNIERVLDPRVYAHREGGDVRDRGSEPRETSCEIKFWDRPPLAGESPDSALPYEERFEKFFVKANSGVAQQFVHPRRGGFRALVRSLVVSDTAREDEVILVSCVFVEDGAPSTPLLSGSSRPQTAGIGDAEFFAAQAEAWLASAQIESDAISNAQSTLAGWSSSEVRAQEVTSSLRTATKKIEDLQDEVQAATDIDSYEGFVAFERLLYSMREAAETFRQAQPQFRDFENPIAQPLLRLVANLYGGSTAELRFAQIVEYNDIEDPGRVTAGAVLRIPVADPDRRLALRSAA